MSYASLQSEIPGVDLLMVDGNWRLQRLMLHVTTHVEDSPSLTRAAQICGLERTYFCRFFRTRVGISFSEWSRRVRVERAKTLLRSEHRSVLAVALAVGYKDITTFERNFRRCEHLSPAEYRKLQRAIRVHGNTTSADKFTRIAETRGGGSPYCRSVWPSTIEHEIHVGMPPGLHSSDWESSRPWRSTSGS